MMVRVTQTLPLHPTLTGSGSIREIVSNAQSVPDVERIIAASSVPGGESKPIFISDYSGAQADSPFSGSAFDPFPQP